MNLSPSTGGKEKRRRQQWSSDEEEGGANRQRVHKAEACSWVSKSRQSSDMADQKGNRILSGRQLQRTPPPHVDVVRHLDFCTEDNEDQVEPQQNTGVRVEI